MPELVMVSSVEKLEKLKVYLGELFQKERYAEITQAIGMHSILIDPQHMLRDQTSLYHLVLHLLKDRLSKAKGKLYAEWYAGFPKHMDDVIASNKIVVDQTASDVIASHRAAYGPFKSVEDFFSWALDDRRLELKQIVKYIEATQG
jgi:hypothetical protein